MREGERERVKGQERLTRLFASYTFDGLSALPNTILLVGHRGSGRHTLTKELTDRLKLSIVDITEGLVDIDNTIDTAYLCDLSKVSREYQNKLLKLVEEPRKHVYVICFAEQVSDVIETLLNRFSSIFYMDTYTPEFLKDITGTDFDDVVYSVYDTPGLVKEAESIDIAGYRELIGKILNFIGSASYPNTLSIADKYDFDRRKFALFLEMLRSACIVGLHEGKKCESILSLACDTLRALRHYPALGNKSDVVGFLSRLWETARDGTERAEGDIK